MIVLLSIPVDLSFSVSVLRGTEGYVRIGWLFGLIRIPVKLNKPASATKQSRRNKRPKAKKKRSTVGPGLLRRGEFWRWLQRLLKRLLGRVEIVQLFIRLRLGLGDPADTGRLWAVMGPVSVLLGSIPQAQVSIEPDFMEAQLRLESKGQIRLYPIRIIGLMLVTALSPQTWRALRARGG